MDSRATPAPDDRSGLSAALLDWRAREGLNRMAAARRLGVAHPTLRGWELAGVCPQPVQLHRLAVVLQRDVEEVRALAGPDRVRTVRTSGGSGASPLCRARLAAGLTTTQLSLRLGVAPSTVSRWENGSRSPSPEVWARLASVLRLDPARPESVLAGNRPRRPEGVALPGLGQLRRESGMTQRTFREAVGIGATAAIDWEHGRVPVPTARLDDVAVVLGVDRATLLRVAGQAPRGQRGKRPLADLRRAAGLTQREMALHLGVSPRTVAHWEAGTRPLALSTARSLARLLRHPLPRIAAAARLQLPPISSPRTWRPADLPGVLTALRGSSGWSAAALGRRIGARGGTLRSWEEGVTLPSLSACQRLELVYGLPRGVLTSLRPALGVTVAAGPARSRLLTGVAR